MIKKQFGSSVFKLKVLGKGAAMPYTHRPFVSVFLILSLIPSAMAEVIRCWKSFKMKWSLGEDFIANSRGDNLCGGNCGDPQFEPGFKHRCTSRLLAG